MTRFNICVVRPKGYLWSSAFAELSELLQYSIEDNNHKCSITENSLNPYEVNLILGCHLLEESQFTSIPSNSVIIQTEQIGAGPELWNKRIVHLLNRFQSWDYSDGNIEMLRKLGVREPTKIRIGYHPKLSRIEGKNRRDIDVLFYGSINESRRKVLDKLSVCGLRVTYLFGCFGAERDYYIDRSKIVLNLHQHAAKAFEIVRCHYLMNNRKAIVSQFDHDTKMDFDYIDGLYLSSYEDIQESCITLLSQGSLLQQLESKALETLTRIDSISVMSELLENTF